MQLPFTEAQFLDVFRAYNAALWPVVVGLWLVTFAFTVALLRGRAHPIASSALTAVHWVWSGVAYHAVFFTRINPAAWLFAGLFVAQAVAFLWFGVLLTSAASTPRSLFVIPIAWSVVAGSAALVLGMTPDLMLFAAGLCLVAYGVMPGLFHRTGLEASDRAR